MLLSMTGFGEAHSQQDGLIVAVEVRAINSRFFKLSVRATEGYASLEPHIEEIARRIIRRGTVQVNLRVDRLRSCQDFRINSEVLNGYREQLQALYRKWDDHAAVSLEALLPLPGVVNDQSMILFSPEDDWPAICKVLQAALENLAQMRIREGQAMADDLSDNCRAIAAGVEEIQRRAPMVLDVYRTRLEDRLNKVLSGYEVTLDPADVIREVSLYADRGDISEEIVRLRSHLEQFDSIMQLPESSGRKLEFLTQELFREANTIGSKASDVEIAKQVIEIKTAIERIREMIQNIE
ncbi:MAG: YicC/YloC family endoribonuclease [Thermoguttaceae bacterium]